MAGGWEGLEDERDWRMGVTEEWEGLEGLRD